MPIIAFLDYDNVKPAKDNTKTDVVYNLELLIEKISTFASHKLVRKEELVIRIYGGWINENGQFSQSAEWILSVLSSLRSRKNNLMIKPSLITSAVCMPAEHLKGLVRVNTRPMRQKMVDSLLTVDALHIAQYVDNTIFIVSDDDDFVPCAIALSQGIKSNNVHLLRVREAGCALNDKILRKAGVNIVCINNLIEIT